MIKRKSILVAAFTGFVLLVGAATGLAWLGTKVPVASVDDLSWGYGVTPASFGAPAEMAALPAQWGRGAQ
jgi:hypothetical protein